MQKTHTNASPHTQSVNHSHTGKRTQTHTGKHTYTHTLIQLTISNNHDINDLAESQSETDSD